MNAYTLPGSGIAAVKQRMMCPHEYWYGGLGNNLTILVSCLILQKMPHGVRRGPNRHYCLFQLELITIELMTPIFKFIRFVRIDSVVGERSPFYSGNGHGISLSSGNARSAREEKDAANAMPKPRIGGPVTFRMIFSAQETP